MKWFGIVAPPYKDVVTLIYILALMCCECSSFQYYNMIIHFEVKDRQVEPTIKWINGLLWIYASPEKKELYALYILVWQHLHHNAVIDGPPDFFNAGN